VSARALRRSALVALSGLCFALGGCGRSALAPASDGSTLRSTWRDPSGAGTLVVAQGERLRDRTDLAPAAPAEHTLATFAELNDTHLVDAESPARVTFLNRLGSPFQSTFRPQETLDSRALDGTVRSINALKPQAVIEGGDLIDNDQADELDRALAVLRGGRVREDSGGPGYAGVQSPQDGDPFYYRPGVDAPRHPALLAVATQPFEAAGLSAPWFPVLGNHDALVAGEVAASSATQRLAVGRRAIWSLPRGLVAPSPSERLAAPLVGRLLSSLQRAPAVNVAPDATRRELSAPQTVARLHAASGHGGRGALLDYSFDIGASVRAIVLDLVRRDSGSGGLVRPEQVAWLSAQLRAAGRRWVLVISHQPLPQSTNGAAAMALLDHDPHVLALLGAHTHRNRIQARHTPAGGMWMISTSSGADYPQQARAFRLVATPHGVALQTWMLDHAPDAAGDVARQLAYLDARGGRPMGFSGSVQDRNVTLYRSAAPGPQGG